MEDITTEDVPCPYCGGCSHYVVLAETFQHGRECNKVIYSKFYTQSIHCNGNSCVNTTWVKEKRATFSSTVTLVFLYQFL